MKCMQWSIMAVVLFFVAVAAECQTNAPVAPDSKARPKIGLVLGGGGALGISHIGVLKALERMQIPVDYIGGTSMGSIIAGLYASGMPPEEMERVFLSLDWWDVMKDKTPYRDLDFRRKEENARYLMDLELGVRGWRLQFPHGFAAGQKFNNLMQSLTVNAAGVQSFDKLNIPFRAVATDLRSGKAVVLDHGNLATAMRASMAVPAVFTPVEIDGQLLVDGGLVNNIPVDIVKAMGADIIIAVDVGASDDKAGRKSSFKSLGDIIGRTYTIMQRSKDEVRRKAADVLIEPELNGLTAGDFHRSKSLIACGITAGLCQSNELSRLSIGADDYALWQASQRKQRQGELTIRSIEVIGNKTVPTALIMKRIETEPGDRVDFHRLSKDVARVHGMGGFSTVTQRLVPTGNPGECDLKIDTVEKYWGPAYMHMGLRLESDFNGVSVWSVLFNYRRDGLNDLGGELRADLQAGKENSAMVEWYQPLQERGYFFIAPSVKTGSERINLYQDGDLIAEYDQDTTYAKLDLGTQFKQYGELRGGILAGTMSVKPSIGDSDLQSADPQLGAFMASFTIDRLDASVFPKQGSYVKVNGMMSREELGADDEYEKVEGEGKWVATWGNHTGMLKVQAGYDIGDDLPAYEKFAIGGMLTLPGLAPGELRGSYYDVVGLVYRYQIGQLSPSMGKGVYVLGGLGAGNAWQTEDEIDLNDLVYGGMLGVAMDTIVGPVALGVGRAEEGAGQIYLTVGTLF